MFLAAAKRPGSARIERAVGSQNNVCVREGEFALRGAVDRVLGVTVGCPFASSPFAINMQAQPRFLASGLCRFLPLLDLLFDTLPRGGNRDYEGVINLRAVM